ncbi:MAG: ComEC/Rec2 family competence protein [Bacteroidaceae bacterium]|nr:ComEC/Rec2 family competence protein [Bacteroidaceae bacterium]
MLEFDIKNYPLLKLALPLIGGIVIGWLCNVDLLHTATLFALSLLAVAAGFSSRLPAWLFGVGATGAMLAIGLFVITCDKAVETPRWSGRKVACEAQLLEVPYMGGVATRALAYVVADDGSAADERSEGRVNIFFANSVEAEALRVGEKVRFEAVIENPRNAGNPAEFDVERYMRLKGVSGSVFLPVGGWQSVGMGNVSLQMRALALRDDIVKMYERQGFEGNALSLLAAFSVGEKRGFSQELKEVYSDAGVSHLLALSGLHLGLFYMVVVTLLGLAGGSRKWYIARELLALLLLWVFAFVAGLTPSIVRAAVLFSLVSVGRCLRRDSSSLNSLAFAAMVMLLFSPRLLFDISFQLSFSAVLAIILLTPWLRELFGCNKHGRLYRSAVSLLAVSFSAQVGVLPFVWYYFGTFPLYFLFANLLLVPLATVLMTLVVQLWVTVPVPLVQQCVAWLLSWLLAFMNGVVEFVASLPAASVMLPQVGVAGACFTAFMLVAFFYCVMRRRYLFAALISMAAVVTVMLNIFTDKGADYSDSVLLFNNNKSGAALVLPQGGEGYVVSSVPKFDSDADRVLVPFMEREGITSVRWLESPYTDSCVSYSDGLLSFAGVRMQLLADDCWLSDSLQHPVDVLWLCRGFLGPVERLLEVYPASCIVLDGSLYAGSRRRLLRECGAAGVGCIDISQLGAVKLKAADGSFSVETMRGK